MRVGVILTGFGMEEYVEPCLDAWLAARRSNLDGHEFVICAVSVPFAGFPNDVEDNTTSLLFDQMSIGNIDHLIDGPRNIPETTARGMALQWLKGREVDILWQVDLDELYAVGQIGFILKTIQMDGNRWCDWYRLSFKNYTFDTKTYLVDPFQPPRIHRMIPSRYTNLRPHCFIADNDIGYMDKNEAAGAIWPQSSLASGIIPPHGVWITHMTWQSNDRSRRKVAYQIARWGDACSFRWDENRGLIFNPALPPPKTAVDA